MFTDDFMMRLIGKVPDECLQTIRQQLDMVLVNYDVTQKETGIVVYQDTIPQAVKMYLASRKIEGLSDKTLQRYEMALRMFFENVGKPIEEVRTNDIRAYLYMLLDSGRQAASALDGTRGCIRTFYEWAVDEGYVDKNPARQIRPIKGEIKERQYLTDAELERVRDACGDLTEVAMIEFMYSTGCRVGELVALKKTDIDFGTHEVKIYGKGNKHRTSYMNAKCEYSLRKYMLIREDDSPYLFVGRRKPHGPYTNRGVEKMIEQIGKKAGLTYRLMPHILRHTTATHALQRGMDVTEIQQLLGHSKLDTTMIYAKISQEDVKANHRKYVI